MSYRAAAHIIGASPSSRLESSRQWGQLAAYFSSAPLEGYRYGMALLSQVVWLGTSMTDRHAAISRDVGNLVATAACFAIRFQQYDLALEWMEQGRSIVWGQLLQLRTPLDELSDHCPKLVEELQELSSKLESASILSLIEQPPVVTGGLLHDTSIGQRRLAERREELLESARMLPGFEDFLLPPKAEKLTGLMKEGVAVVVNMHGSQCDALVIRSQTLAISHVPLLGFSFQEAEQLHNQLKSCMAAQGSRRGVRKGECKPSFDRILSLLWHKVVKPVINHLGINLRAGAPPRSLGPTGRVGLKCLNIAGVGAYLAPVPFKAPQVLACFTLDHDQSTRVPSGASVIAAAAASSTAAPTSPPPTPVQPAVGAAVEQLYDPLLEDLPHITWCTTGPLSFLPLHAAGDYSHPSTALPYLAVSSYTPTISALAQPCGTSSDTFSGLLAVGHASPVRGLSPLPGTKAELDKVASYAAGIKMTRLDEENACADAVLQALNEHSWVHFACHGSQNPLEPMKSALHLHDQDLTLSTIAGNRLKNGQLAFLSACQTATGDSDLPDESIHLAAGLLMAGYPAVIATMWSIDDRDAPIVAGKVYECLLQNNFPDSRKAAKALHVAVASLRESIGADQFARWVPYVHIGR
ncbi:hypothetical protein FRC09_007633 [Ceratobasidium sp. 395]|nr:hypothetical protein FRC09_007633 [Ceratobasidium sp. 395]